METTKWKSGGYPVGYSYDKEKKELIFDPHFKQIVKQIFSLALTRGLSALKIAEHLNGKNIKSRRGKEWSYKTVASLFNPKKIDFYSGLNPKGKPGNWQPIITTGEAKRLKAKNIVSTVASRPRHNVFLLPGLGLTICGYCGGTLKSSSTQRRGKETTFYYFCSKKQNKGSSSCPKSKVIRQNLIDEKVIASLQSQHRDINNIAKYTNREAIKIRTTNKPNIKKLFDKISKVLARQSSATDDKTFDKLAAELTRLISIRSELVKSGIVRFDFKAFKKEKIQNINRLSIDTQRMLIQKYIKKITVFTNKIIIEYPFVINPKGKTKISLEV